GDRRPRPAPGRAGPRDRRGRGRARRSAPDCGLTARFVRIASYRAVCEPTGVHAATVSPAGTSLLDRLSDPELLRSDLFLRGEWVPASDGARFDVVDPAEQSVIASVASATRDDTRRAVESAAVAFPAWAAKTAKERAAILRRWFELIVAAADDLGAILTAEQGETVPEARRESLV